jgi:hypothetical protein
MAGEADRCAPSADILQPLGSAAQAAGDQNVAISRAKLSRLLLLQ